MKVTSELQRSQKSTNGYISQCITLTDIMPGTKVQYNKWHLMTSAFLSLTKGQSHTAKPKVTDMEVSALSECFLFLHLHEIEGLIEIDKIWRNRRREKNDHPVRRPFGMLQGVLMQIKFKDGDLGSKFKVAITKNMTRQIETRDTAIIYHCYFHRKLNYWLNFDSK